MCDGFNLIALKTYLQEGILNIYVGARNVEKEIILYKQRRKKGGGADMHRKIIMRIGG